MEFLQEKIRNRAINVCTGELAWDYSDIVYVIKSLYENQFLILGGDVINKDLSYTYDNWYYNYNYALTYEENINISFNQAIEYVKNYNLKFGDLFYYVVVYEKLRGSIVFSNQ